MIIWWPLGWWLAWKFARLFAVAILGLEVLLLLTPDSEHIIRAGNKDVMLPFYWPLAVPGALIVASWIRRIVRIYRR